MTGQTSVPRYAYQIAKSISWFESYTGGGHGHNTISKTKTNTASKAFGKQALPLFFM
jgi:hypothetical protein